MKKPDWVNFDADKVLLAQKTENKNLDDYIHQYKHGKYLDRLEAIDAAARKQEEIKGVDLLTLALNDKYYGLRSHALGKLDLRKQGLKAVAEPILADLARNDIKRTVRAAAISKLGDYRQAKYLTLFKTALNDSSYTVAGNALEALGKVDSVAALTESKRLSALPAKGKLANAISGTMIMYGDESASNVILENFENMPLSQAKFEALQPLSQFLTRVKTLETFKRGINAIDAFHMEIPQAYRSQVTPAIEGLLKMLQKTKMEAGNKEMAEYIDTKLNKKGF
jgi:aminopeptidase N